MEVFERGFGCFDSAASAAAASELRASLPPDGADGTLGSNHDVGTIDVDESATPRVADVSVEEERSKWSACGSSCAPNSVLNHSESAPHALVFALPIDTVVPVSGRRAPL